MFFWILFLVLFITPTTIYWFKVTMDIVWPIWIFAILFLILLGPINYFLRG